MASISKRRQFLSAVWLARTKDFHPRHPIATPHELVFPRIYKISYVFLSFRKKKPLKASYILGNVPSQPKFKK